MNFPYSTKSIFLTTVLLLIPVAASASCMLQVEKFNGSPTAAGSDFADFLHERLVESGIVCSNSSEPHSFSRYSISGLVENDAEGTSFSAMLTDKFHLEPEVFINGKQVGGKTSEPAAEKLAGSVAALLSDQKISSIEVSGYSRLTENAVIALSGIFPGETATPEKIIAARIILENCGLFDQVRLYLIPGADGRKVKIYVREGLMVSAGDIPRPGVKALNNILGPADSELPEFPELPESYKNELRATDNSTDSLIYEAGRVLQELSATQSANSPEQAIRLINVAAALRNNIQSQTEPCTDRCIILMKLCSMLDSETIKSMTEELQHSMELGPDNPSFEKILARIEFLGKAQSAAQEAQTILAAKIYACNQLSPITPWVLSSLGEQALKNEDTARAAPLMAAAVSVSSLPVPPEMLITTAKAQFSNLECQAGAAAAQALSNLLTDTDLPPALRRKITDLSEWESLSKTASSISDTDNFEMLLKKGNALILLDRPDLAEPLFHELHGSHPDDARPFTGFARLAFQRTGTLLSVRPYIERAEHLSGKDRFFYELALAYKLERITKEALPTIHLEGRNSEEASATRFLLPKALIYTAGYENFNRPQALLLERGISILDSWLAYPVMTDQQALDSMYRQTSDLREQIPDSDEIIAANCYFSIFANDREEVREMLVTPQPAGVGIEAGFLRMNLLLKEMAEAPSETIAAALNQAGQAAFSDEHNRSRAVALQADAHAVLGFYHNSSTELERARSLYGLALGITENGARARLLNNQACVSLALDRIAEADDLYDEAQDLSPQEEEAVVFGKIMTAKPENEQEAALTQLAEKAKNIRLRKILRKTLAKTGADNTAVGVTVTSAGMPEILLQEQSDMESAYDNYNGLQFIFTYNSNIWLLPRCSPDFPE